MPKRSAKDAFKADVPQPPRRVNSWTKEEIIVFIEANGSLKMMCTDETIACGDPSYVLEVPRWNNTLDIYSNSKGGSRRYIATIKLNRLPRRQKVKRLLGSVKKLYVFDSAIPRDSPVQ